MKRNILIFSFIIFLSLIIFITFSAILYNYPALAIDDNILNSMVNSRGNKYGFIYWVFTIFAEFGHTYFVILFLILFAIYTKVDYRFFIILFVLLLAICFNQIAKTIIQRPRPLEELMWASEDEYSFPSGHSNIAGVIYPYLIFLVLESKKDVKFKVGFTLIFNIILFLVLLSRLVLAVHYFSDVLVGLFTGLMFSSIGVLLIYYFRKHHILEKPLFDYFKKKNKEEINNEKD